MIDDKPAALSAFRDRSVEAKKDRNRYAGQNALSRVGSDLDGTLNFRVNSGLKAEFDKLCKANHTTSARELKRFMSEAIATQSLI